MMMTASETEILQSVRERLRRSGIAASLLKSEVTLVELERECSASSELGEILDYVLEQCVRYAITVCKYKSALIGGINAELLGEVEDERKIVHNSTIDAINALARAIKRSGGDSRWINNIAGNRSAYGKLALLLAFEKIERYQTEAV